MNSLVHAEKSKTTDELIHKIMTAATPIRADHQYSLESYLFNSIIRRAEMCLQAAGGHFVQLLKFHCVKYILINKTLHYTSLFCLLC